MTPRNQSGGRLPNNLEKSLAGAYPTAEIRMSNSGEWHDRYVLAETRLLLLGQGLKDFGNKESFVIILDEEFAPIKTVKDAFENHWEAAQPLG